MCLAKAFVNKWSGQPILQDIAHLQVHKNKVEMVTFFGEEKVVPGRVVEIDFTASKILLEQRHKTDSEV